MVPVPDLTEVAISRFGLDGAKAMPDLAGMVPMPDLAEMVPTTNAVGTRHQAWDGT